MADSPARSRRSSPKSSFEGNIPTICQNGYSLAQPQRRRSSTPDSVCSTSTVDTEREHDFYRFVNGRRLNSMNKVYMLPADAAEIKRMDLEHRMVKFILGANYVGPLADVLAPQSNIERRILDCGTGSGIWAIEMADEFTWVTVVGVDLAPIQPREVPPNCHFELFDMDNQPLPYPDAWFDVVHCRSVYTGIRNYPRFLAEVARVLRPGGIVILAEADSAAMTENKRPIREGSLGGAPGWFALWNNYRHALTAQGIDPSIPTRLKACLREVRAFDRIVAQEALIPIGFWPKDPVILTIGQLAWMNYDCLITSFNPFFSHFGLSEATINKLIEDAQKDLYFPSSKPSACWHIVHAQKAPGAWS